jgi:hypothetical protein
MSFPVLSFMVSLKAARAWGLPPADADAIALRFDPRRARDTEHLVDALADTLIARGVVEVPAFP